MNAQIESLSPEAREAITWAVNNPGNIKAFENALGGDDVAGRRERLRAAVRRVLARNTSQRPLMRAIVQAKALAKKAATKGHMDASILTAATPSLDRWARLARNDVLVRFLPYEDGYMCVSVRLGRRRVAYVTAALAAKLSADLAKHAPLATMRFAKGAWTTSRKTSMLQSPRILKARQRVLAAIRLAAREPAYV